MSATPPRISARPDDDPDDRVQPGRFMADPPPGTVLFLFGMRANSLPAMRHWLPLWRQTQAMIRELKAHPESGLLWSTSWREGREGTVLQYWRSMEALMTWAQDARFAHASLWKAFNHGIGDSGQIGLWHEAVVIDGETPGHLHTIYRDVPERGLAAATTRVDAEHHAMRTYLRDRRTRES
ncbi:MAG: monooxygenase family protein [Thermomicrobiales bacterium]